MASTLVETPRSAARSTATLVLPWLMSSTFHASLLLAMALVWQWSSERVPPAITRGVTMQVELVGTGHTGEGGISDASSGDPALPEGGYYDDEPQVAAQASGSLPEGPGQGPGRSLGALLAEKPMVSLAGVLPAAAVAGGGGTGQGDGVGSAQALSTDRGGSSRLRGGYARTGVFGVAGEGHKFVYVFDRSGSMDGHGGAPLSAAKNELLGSLRDLGQTHQFQIIFYNDNPRVFNPGVRGQLVFGTDQNKYLAQKFVGSITADGATRHEEALEMALKMNPDVVFFLTDADEPRMTPQQLARVARLNRGASINTIEFGYGTQAVADNFLVKLARQNGGKHIYVDISQLPVARR